MEKKSTTKSSLALQLAEKRGLTAKLAEEIVNDMMQGMSEALAMGDRIEIRGFGSFAIREYDSYIGRNPKTGEQIQVNAKKLPFFKAGKAWQERLNKG